MRSSYIFHNMDGKFLQMTENHLAMSGSVPRVPEMILAGPSGTDTDLFSITPKG